MDKQADFGLGSACDVSELAMNGDAPHCCQLDEGNIYR